MHGLDDRVTGALAPWARVVDPGSNDHEVHLVLLIAAYVVALGGWRLRASLTSRGERAVDRPQQLPRLRHDRVTFVAGASIVSAVVHLVVSPEHFAEDWTYGAFFVVLASLQLLWALLMLSRPSLRMLQVGVGAMVLLLLLWAETRLIGLGVGPLHRGREPAGLYDVFAGLVELALIAVALSIPGVGSRHFQRAGHRDLDMR